MKFLCLIYVFNHKYIRKHIAELKWSSWWLSGSEQFTKVQERIFFPMNYGQKSLNTVKKSSKIPRSISVGGVLIAVAGRLNVPICTVRAVR